jgi:hypothetical protein
MRFASRYSPRAGKSALTTTATDTSRRARFFAEAIEAGYPANRMEADFAAAADPHRCRMRLDQHLRHGDLVLQVGSLASMPRIFKGA